MAVSCCCISPRPALKERGPALGPCLPLSSLSCLGKHDERAGQFIGIERICPRGDDQLAELLHLAVLEVARLVPECLQFSIKVSWLTHHLLRER